MLLKPCFGVQRWKADNLAGIQHAEVARLTEIAVRLLARLGVETAVGFLFYEIFGRPDRPELLDYAERLHRTSSIAPFIVEEFLPLVPSQQ